MNIAFCYERVLPERGGCERYIAQLAHRLVRDGHAVHLYAAQWDAAALPALIHVHRLPAGTGPRLIRPWRFAHHVAEALQHHTHDVTIGFDKTYGQDILYPQGGLPRASAVHNLRKHPPGLVRMFAGWLKALDPAARSHAMLEDRQYHHTPRPTLIVNSAFVRGHFETYHDIPASEITVIPNAVDPDRFAPEDRLARRAAERERWNVSPEMPVALFCAMNYRLKGLIPLLHAVARLNRPLTLAVVGSPKTARFEKLARSLGIAERVRFLGYRADVRDAFFAADLFTHPTFYDTCSLVLLEALACGLPVVTTQTCGAAELFTPGIEGQVIADPHDHAALARAIETYLDPQARAIAGTAARKLARDWTFEKHYRRLMHVIGGVVRQKLAA